MHVREGVRPAKIDDGPPPAVTARGYAEIIRGEDDVARVYKPLCGDLALTVVIIVQRKFWKTASGNRPSIATARLRSNSHYFQANNAAMHYCVAPIEPLV